MAGPDDADSTTCARCHADLPAIAAFCPHCGASTAQDRASGPVLAGYTILRTLGHGGASVVYLAQQESLDRQVAVKVLRRDVEEPKVWRHFLREARTIARLSGHPNVVTVHTAGRSQAGQPYLVTEFLDRGSLGDVIAAQGPLPPAVVTEIGLAVADALVAAHGLGILHRDVKPGNVLLDRDGRAKLGDFGIARLLAGQSVTTTDVIAFSPEHVAPEILRGEPDGPWSDLYGLASTLAAALVGAPLFTRRPDERVEALLLRKLMAPPPSLPASVPAMLAGVVTQGLDPDPTRRPSLGEFRERLAVAADALGAAVPLPPPEVAAPASATAPALADHDAHDAPGPPATPLLGPLRRSRRRLLAIPALLVAVVAATLAVAALAGEGGNGNSASRGTSPVVVASTSGGATAPPSVPPSAAPAPGVPGPSTAVTSAATTAAPATTLPPVASAPAPATTAPPAPATTAPAAPPSSPPATPPAPTAPAPTPTTEAEAFVRSYYDAVMARDYETSWSRLTPEFQRGTARSYDYYVGFWDDNDVEVGEIGLVDADQDQVIVNVELRWNGSGDAVTEQFTLRRGEGGELLIADQRTVDG